MLIDNNIAYLHAPADQAGWGIAWYIDGDLAPELVVERGKSYTFIVSGGDDRNNEAEYHPFYITDSIMGGRLLFTTDERAVSWLLSYLNVY